MGVILKFSHYNKAVFHKTFSNKEERMEDMGEVKLSK